MNMSFWINILKFNILAILEKILEHLRILKVRGVFMFDRFEPNY